MLHHRKDIDNNIAAQSAVIPRSIMPQISPNPVQKIYSVHDLHSHVLLKAFLEHNFKNLLIRWVQVTTNTVEIHDHDTDSLIIACKGQCKLIGDWETTITEGDVVIIPKYSKHGLSPCGDVAEDFWGFSLRFG